jgi:hypothetical protein
MESIRLRQLPFLFRLILSLFVVTLGAGYLVALLNLYLTYAMTDGDPKLTPEDLRRAFYGNRNNTRLAAKIDGGSMEQFLTRPGDKEKILSWIQDGASKIGYEDMVRPITAEFCIRCHSPGRVSSFRPLTSYEEVLTVTQIDRGEPVGLWARVAHTHIQSFALIFLCLGSLFAFTSFSGRVKAFVVLLPFGAIMLDFGGRLLAHTMPAFVFAVMAGGALLGLSFAVMILVPLWEMWLKK